MNKPDFKSSPRVDQVGVEDKVARFGTRSIKKESKVQALKLALSMIDHTTLEGMDSDGRIEQLCHKAMQPIVGYPDIPTVAAVCVYPPFIKKAKSVLKNSRIKVASVATAFPSGHAPLQYKIDETKLCVDSGADEVDMVISRGRFHQGDYNYVFDEIAAIKEACGSVHLKVILETGELGTLDQVRRASDIAIYAGGDFIKTSTGKVQPGATLPVTLVMLEAIRDYYDKTGIMVGMKPAGGVKDSKTALKYLIMLKETLGSAWLSPDWFRFGASSLTNDLLMQIVKQKSGNYQSLDYFSQD